MSSDRVEQVRPVNKPASNVNRSNRGPDRPRTIKPDHVDRPQAKAPTAPARVDDAPLPAEEAAETVITPCPVDDGPAGNDEAVTLPTTAPASWAAPAAFKPSAAPAGSEPTDGTPAGDQQPPAADVHEATTALGEASHKLDELRAQAETASPDEIEGINASIAEQEGLVEQRQSALTDSLVEQRRHQAQQTTSDPGHDLYSEQSDQFLATTVEPGLAGPYRQAVERSRTIAMAAEPVNLTEAQWQRIGETWAAQRAQAQLEEQIRGSGGAVLANGQFEDPALNEQYQVVQTQWAKVTEAWGDEYQMVANAHEDPADAIEAVSHYRQDAANIAVDSPYRDQIVQAAERATIPNPEVDRAISERTETELQRINEVLSKEGPSAALNAVAAAKAGLTSRPITVTGVEAGDAVVLASAQGELDAGLQEVYRQIAANAASDLRGLRPEGKPSLAQQTESALAVTQRLSLYTSVLPANLVPDVVSDSRDAWQPAVDFLGTWSKEADPSRQRGRDPNPRDVSSQTFDKVVTNFSAVAENLAASPGGDAPLAELGSAFADAISANSIGAFDDAFGRTGVGQGEGSHLAVSTINHLVQDEDGRNAANALLLGLKDGYEIWADRADDDFRLFAQNRAPLQAAVERWPGNTRLVGGTEMLDPNDPSSVELNAAISAFFENNPEMLETDLRLLRQLNTDGLFLLNTDTALAGLSEQASSLDAFDAVFDPLATLGVRNPDATAGADAGADGAPSRATVYAAMPAVQAEVNRSVLELADWQRQGIASGELDVGHTLSAQMAESASQIQVEQLSRNARTMIYEWTHNVTGLVKIDQAPYKLVAKGLGGSFSLLAARSAFGAATAPANAKVTDLDRAVQAVKGLNYVWVGARDLTEVSLAISRSGALKETALGRAVTDKLQPLLWLTGPESKVFKGDHQGLARGLHLASRGLSAATDFYTLLDDKGDGRGTGVLVGDALLAAGSTGMLAEGVMVALGMPTNLLGPIAWTATGLTVAGAAVKLAADWAERANVYETADTRRFLAHFGSRDENGNLKPVTGQTQVSNAVGHDPDIRTAAEGGPQRDDIVYRGLSAEAVDALMNDSFNPSAPKVASRRLRPWAPRPASTTGSSSSSGMTRR